VIRIAEELVTTIMDAAEAAYPGECCGLLVGVESVEGGAHVTRIVASDNVAAGDTRDSFEVDPKVRFELMRELGEIGERPKSQERLIGHYHSHPNHPPRPSARDLAAAYEPDLIWIIVGVAGGKATTLSASILNPEGTKFRQIPLRRPDGAPYSRALEPASEDHLT